MTKPTMIEAHGGTLVDRTVSEDKRQQWESRRSDLPGIQLDDRQRSDLEMIAIGAYSPLKGFMNRENHESVLKQMRLSDGTVWPIPITLSVDEDTARGLTPGDPVALEDQQGQFLAVLHLEETYRVDTQSRAEAVFRTGDPDHPGVRQTLEMGTVSLAGPVEVLRLSEDPSFPQY